MSPGILKFSDGRECRTGREKKFRQAIFRGRDTISKSPFKTDRDCQLERRHPPNVIIPVCPIDL